MSRIKKIILFLAVIAVSLTALLVVRTLLYQRDQDIKTLSHLPNDFSIDKRLSINHLRQAIRYRTITPNADSSRGTSEEFVKLHQYLQQSYPLFFKKLKLTPYGKHGLLFFWQGNNQILKPVMFIAHQDVVPISPGTTGDWDYPPFTGTLEDGYIWGRGSLDDKDNLIAIFEAVELLLRQGYRPERSYYFLFNDTEESGGEQLVALAETLKARNIRFDYILDEGGAIIDGLMPDIAAPIAIVGIAEKGYVDVKLTARAHGGHSSMPEENTTIGLLAEAIVKLRKHKMPARISGVSKLMLTELGHYMPFYKRLIFANLWLFETPLIKILTRQAAMNAAMRTTTAPTVIRAGKADNALPVKAEAIINFRILPGDTVQSVMQHVEAVIDNPHITTEVVGPATEPVFVSSTKTQTYQLISRVITTLSSGTIVVPGLLIGATDSRHFRVLTDDIYRFNLIEAEMKEFENMHGTNERISVNNFIKNINFYYLLIKKG